MSDNTSTRIEKAFELLRSGQTSTARSIFAELRYDEASAVDAYRGLSACAWADGQQAGAIQMLAEAVRLNPERADARADMALLTLASGQAEASLVHWEALLSLQPENPEAWHNYGKALADSRRLEDAAAAFERSLKLAPKQMSSYATYAKALASSGDNDAAEAVWRRALAVDSSFDQAWNGLGELLFNQAQLEESLEVYRQAVLVLPDSPEINMGLGQLLDDFSDKDGAELQFRRALELRPGWVQPLEALLTLLGGKADDEFLTLAQSCLNDPKAPPAQRANAGYGLGKALDGRGESDQAFAVWNVANAARREQVGGHEQARVSDRVSRLIKTFTPEFFAERADWGLEDERPVFVVGMPRSGTSLVEQIIAAHPDAYGYGELMYVPNAPDRLTQMSGSMHQWPESLDVISRENIRTVAQGYLDHQQARQESSAIRLIDKAPMNFFHLGLIKLMFPRAHIIWCRRDPRDICVSIYSQNFSLKQRHATDLADLGHYYREQQRIMRHWTSLPTIKAHECVYEEIIADSDTQSRALLASIGLPWNEQCSRFYDDNRPVLTPSRWQVRRPIYTQAVARWKRYEKHLGPLIEALGDEVPE